MSERSNGHPPLPPRSDFDQEIELLALLEDPVRRSLYAHVVRQADYVSRDGAAKALGIARGLAAFHLDRLVAEGLLETVYRRLAGRAGPGAGRPAKLYRRSRRQVTLSLPPRDYELLARLLATALDDKRPEPVTGHITRAAREVGTARAVEARRLAGRRANRRRLIEAGLTILWRQGYEPRRNGSDIELLNCPFYAVAKDHQGLVCSMNLALLGAFAADLSVKAFTPRLEPREDRCCVVFNLGMRTGAADARG
jgi:predicted ArsR family transcriptional regulator